jgi:DNA invertase Pin-like site-specific DNA recombinase
MGRALVATRLSHFTDASTSIERQGETGEAFATLHGHAVVKVTEDVDVSGAVSPWERADLGPWLTDPEKLASWDVLIVAKLDRLSRSISDLDKFIKWCDDHGKTLVSVAESLDLSSATGRMMAKMIGLFAEWELARMSERQLDARKKLRAMAAWGGGVAPYGYDAVSDGSQHYLKVNDAEAAVIRLMVAMVTGGTSLRQVAKTLNDRGIKSARAARWTGGSVGAILRNEIIRGVMTHADDVKVDGKRVRGVPKPFLGDDGMPVRIGEAVIDDDQWTQLQQRLDAGSTRRGGSEEHGQPMLSGGLKCACGAPLYIQRRTVRGKEANRYRHNDSAECTLGYTASHIESAVESVLLNAVGHRERTQRVLVKGKGYGEQVKRYAEQIDALDAAFESGDMDAKTYGRMQAKLDAKLEEFRSLHEAVPAEERDDHYRDVPMGQTYAEHWEEMTTDDRAQFLKDAEVTATVARRGTRLWSADGIAQGEMHTMRVVKNTVVLVKLGNLARLVDMAQGMQLAA